MRSNCIVEAIRLARIIRASKAESGMRGPGHEIYVWFRPSRAKNAPGHVGIGMLDHRTDQLRMLSFKPVESQDVPWYMAWKRLRFNGRYRWGDYPDTQVLDHGQVQ